MKKMLNDMVPKNLDASWDDTKKAAHAMLDDIEKIIGKNNAMAIFRRFAMKICASGATSASPRRRSEWRFAALVPLVARLHKYRQRSRIIAKDPCRWIGFGPNGNGLT